MEPRFYAGGRIVVRDGRIMARIDPETGMELEQIVQGLYGYSPKECDRMAAGAWGRVLLIGMGLGFWRAALVRNPEVIAVTTVEHDPGVLEAWRLDPRADRAGDLERHPIVLREMEDYLERCPEGAFDCFRADIGKLSSWARLRVAAICGRDPGPEGLGT